MELFVRQEGNDFSDLWCYVFAVEFVGCWWCFFCFFDYIDSFYKIISGLRFVPSCCIFFIFLEFRDQILLADFFVSKIMRWV